MRLLCFWDRIFIILDNAFHFRAPTCYNNIVYRVIPLPAYNTPSCLSPSIKKRPRAFHPLWVLMFVLTGSAMCGKINDRKG